MKSIFISKLFKLLLIAGLSFATKESSTNDVVENQVGCQENKHEVTPTEIKNILRRNVAEITRGTIAGSNSGGDNQGSSSCTVACYRNDCANVLPLDKSCYRRCCRICGESDCI